MSKLLFMPFRLLGGLLAGLLGRRAFKASWAMIGKGEPPKAADRSASWGKMVSAVALEAAIFAAARGIVDRAFRQVFSKLTGAWPGEEDEHSGKRRKSR